MFPLDPIPVLQLGQPIGRAFHPGGFPILSSQTGSIWTDPLGMASPFHPLVRDSPYFAEPLRGRFAAPCAAGSRNRCSNSLPPSDPGGVERTTRPVVDCGVSESTEREEFGKRPETELEKGRIWSLL